MIDFGSISIKSDTSYPTRPESSETSSDGSNRKRLRLDNSAKTDSDPKGQKSLARSDTQDLSAEEVRELAELKQRDREVKAHEQAHISGGGSYVRGGAQYEYEKGPDGKNYAVGGEVQIDTSKVSGDSEATLRKMQTIQRAAMAPANPSPQDRRVAAKATQLENNARLEILTQRYKAAAAMRTGTFETENGHTDISDGANQGPAIALGGRIDITG